MTPARIQKAFLLVLLVGISALFLAMVRPFLMTILLAAIMAGLSWPAYRKVLSLLRGRRVPAAIIVVVLTLVVVIVPLATFVGVLVNEAFKVTAEIRPWIEQQIAEPGSVDETFASLPFVEKIEPYRAEIYQKVGELVAGIGNWLVSSLSHVTRGTVALLFHVGILLYTMFFFLLDGRKILRGILYYVPLSDDAEQQMVGKFVSVTRATVKGTLVIGIVQGGLAGAALAIVGVQSAVFWSVVMMVLSIIPGIGTALVWVPVAIMMAATGHWGSAIGLTLWCALVVGSVDNVLRPRLVGRDTEMHDLLILFSTLGGLLLFGVLGFIIGPILAALFVTVWELYGHVFRDALPAVRWLGDDDDEKAAPAGD